MASSKPDRTYTLEPAVVLGKVPESAFRRLDECFENTQCTGIYDREGGAVVSGSPSVLRNTVELPIEVMGPFIDVGNEWLGGGQVSLSYQRGYVSPGNTLRGGSRDRWHFDGFAYESLRAVLFADVMPTEIMNGSFGPPHFDFGSLNFEHSQPYLTDSDIKRGLKVGVIKVQEIPASPCGVGITERTLHASPANNTNKKIARTFMRLSVTGSRKRQ